MNALSHADEVFAEFQRAHPECVLPGNARSPMDDTQTLIIPRELIDACEPEAEVLDAEVMSVATALLPSPTLRSHLAAS